MDKASASNASKNGVTQPQGVVRAKHKLRRQIEDLERTRRGFSGRSDTGGKGGDPRTLGEEGSKSAVSLDLTNEQVDELLRHLARRIGEAQAAENRGEAEAPSDSASLLSELVRAREVEEKRLQKLVNAARREQQRLGELIEKQRVESLRERERLTERFTALLTDGNRETERQLTEAVSSASETLTAAVESTLRRRGEDLEIQSRATVAELQEQIRVEMHAAAERSFERLEHDLREAAKTDREDARAQFTSAIRDLVDEIQAQQQGLLDQHRQATKERVDAAVRRSAAELRDELHSAIASLRIEITRHIDEVTANAVALLDARSESASASVPPTEPPDSQDLFDPTATEVMPEERPSDQAELSDVPTVGFGSNPLGQARSGTLTSPLGEGVATVSQQPSASEEQKFPGERPFSASELDLTPKPKRTSPARRRSLWNRVTMR